MTRCRSILCSVLGLGLLLPAVSWIHAGAGPKAPAAPAKSEQVAQKAMAWLLRTQKPDGVGSPGTELEFAL